MINTLAQTHTRRASQKRISLFGLVDLARQRRTLAALDDHQLADIGLTRAEAQAEADRPIWDAPSTWKA